jgi:metal-dependent hydrolase (beta-lactamase superfamily II)
VHEDEEAGIVVTTTGEIPRVHEMEFSPANYIIEQDGKLVKDTFLDDQALIVEKKGAFATVLLGCCHAGIENTIARVKTLVKVPVKIIAGGFHLTGATNETIARKHDFLESLALEGAGKPGPEKLVVRPTHCSGERFYLHMMTKASSSLDDQARALEPRFFLSTTFISQFSVAIQ